MATVIIVLILVAAIIFGVQEMVKHMKGQGGCCGGGEVPQKMRKRKLKEIVAVRRMRIDGMVCGNCRTRIENALNSIDHVNAKVDLGKKEAEIKMEMEIPDEILTAAVENIGYTVLSLESE